MKRVYKVIQNNLLLIFIKNPEPGKVKTRLASSIGDQKACQVYLKLLELTLASAKDLEVSRQVWYSSFIDQRDFIPEPEFEKKLQRGKDLGVRMSHAFRNGFDEGYRNIIIIGSDCPGVTPALLKRAFMELETHEVVVGPSADGGYYLLGMNHMHSELFRDISWSTEHVLGQTLKKADELSLNASFLPELNDIDTIEDLRKTALYHEIQD